MNGKNWMRMGAAPLLLAGLAAPVVISGCGEDGLGGSCDVQIVAKAEALSKAAAGLAQVAADLKIGVGTACANIASAGGMEPPSITADSPDEDVTMACDMATAAINATFEAGAELYITIEGGKCEANFQASANCQASCDINGTCEPPSIEVQCEPGQLSGSCSGSCEGSCSATAEAPTVACEGSCSGTCMGECQGDCSGDMNSANCNAKCEGTCMGECSGSCEYAPGSAMAECSGSCKGECSVAFEAPSCEGEIQGGQCDIDADCEAGCNAQASFEAECTPPMVIVEFTGTVDAEFIAALEVNLPELLLVFTAQAELLGESILGVAEAFVNVAGEVTASLACVGQLGAGIAAEAAGSVEASASVSVSVSASASASGSATGG